MADTIDKTIFAELQDAAGAEFVTELVDTFLEEAPVMLADLRGALEAQQADRFRRAAHSLKSNCQTFGATQLGAMARDLEANGMSGGTAALDQLEAHYKTVSTALQELSRAG
jgi:HPt (histidine-containing phosphotransfer) domain-containing protein